MAVQVAAKLSLATTLLLVVLSAFAIQTANGKPAPPLVSNEGISLFDGEALSRPWQGLQGLQTYEPAVIASRGFHAIDELQGELLWQLPSKRHGFKAVVDVDLACLATPAVPGGRFGLSPGFDPGHFGGGGDLVFNHDRYDK
ncbi:MAG: hypothetical protein AB2598_20685 [Candidatus Thiodiazotropha sp.]